MEVSIVLYIICGKGSKFSLHGRQRVKEWEGVHWKVIELRERERERGDRERRAIAAASLFYLLLFGK